MLRYVLSSIFTLSYILMRRRFGHISLVHPSVSYFISERAPPCFVAVTWFGNIGLAIIAVLFCVVPQVLGQHTLGIPAIVLRARGVNGFITRAWQLLAGPPGLELQSDGQRNAATAHAVERNHGKSLAL